MPDIIIPLRTRAYNEKLSRYKVQFKGACGEVIYIMGPSTLRRRTVPFCQMVAKEERGFVWEIFVQA